MRIIFWHDGSYLVVSRGGDQAPQVKKKTLSVRNDEEIENYAEDVDDDDDDDGGSLLGGL